MSNPTCNRIDHGERCGWYLVTQEWAEGRNHRAGSGQLVCTGCGRGTDATPEEYAAQAKRDAEWEAQQ